MRRKEVFSPLIAAVWLLGALCAPAAAIEFGYTGPIDSETGSPMRSTQAETVGNQVQLSDGVYFNRTQQGFVYEVPGGGSVLCTVAEGMVVQQAVQVVPDPGVEVKLYRNGTVVEEPNLSSIEEIGDYIVETDANGQTTQLIAFAIVGEITGQLTGYIMPRSFVITSVTRDDEQIGYERGYISMAEEGHYVVDYRCVPSGLDYQLDVVIDHTPPTLALEAVENGRARGPVSIADLEEGVSIGITCNGQQVAYRSELTEIGDYQIVLMDKAGNVSSYEFSILIYFDLNSLVFLGMVAVVLAAIGVYIIVSRKRLKVR